MDYPHPFIRLEDGTIDFSQAYDTGIGEWDKVTVAFAYSDFPEGTDEGEALDQILAQAQQQGLRYISDQDARARGGAHARAHLWDNGSDASVELERVLNIREHAISKFSPANIRSGEAYSILEDVFVPLYFFHRYQTEAAVKAVGGMEYSYAVKGDNSKPWSFASRATQEASLKAVLSTLAPEHLAIPKRVLEYFPPRAMGYGATRESFKGRTGISFDALGAAETAADMTLDLLLHPERASRLIQQQRLDPGQLSLNDVLTSLWKDTFDYESKDPYLQGVAEVVRFRTLHHIMLLAKRSGVHPQVNAAAQATLDDIRTAALKGGGTDLDREVVRRIDAFRERPELLEVPPSPKIPDGSPIGTDCAFQDPLPWK